MANETTSSTLSELFTNITQEAIFTFQETSVMRPLVTTYPISGSGKTIEVPVYPTISASAVNEASDLSNTAVNPTSATITASEVGVMTTLTDLARDSASRNVGADIGKLFGEAIAKKVDTDLAGLLDDFASANDQGGAGTELTADLLFKAQAILRSANVPAPYYAVFHPKATFNLKKTLTQPAYTTSSSGYAISDIGNEALRNGYIGRIAGIDIFENANISIDAYDDSFGGVFHPQSIGLALKEDFKVETQRDASLRATEIVASITVGSGVLKDTYGVTVKVDTAL
jgi:N4-gp56 family major capsid protein